MKTRFREYYRLSSEQIEKIWKGDSLVVFDTNILLNLYCYTSETCKEFFDVMSFYEDRLWIPYQVAWEYHQNRVNKILEYTSEYSVIVELITKTCNNVIDEIKKHSGRTRIPLVKIEEKIKKCRDAICKEIEKEKKEYPDYLENDTILEKISTYYLNKVGDDFSSEELKKICEEGKKRYESKTPPGYRDGENKKNNSDRALYGDLILWKQIIKECADKKKNVIFVTNDRKEDWWLIKKGKTLGARPELLKEFYELTKQNIVLYSGERFLNYAKSYTSIKLNKKTIEEVVKYKDYDYQVSSILDQIHITDGVKQKYAISPSFLKTIGIQDLEASPLSDQICRVEDILGRNGIYPSFLSTAGIQDSLVPSSLSDKIYRPEDILGRNGIYPSSLNTAGIQDSLVPSPLSDKIYRPEDMLGRNGIYPSSLNTAGIQDSLVSSPSLDEILHQLKK